MFFEQVMTCRPPPPKKPHKKNPTQQQPPKNYNPPPNPQPPPKKNNNKNTKKLDIYKQEVKPVCIFHTIFPPYCCLLFFINYNDVIMGKTKQIEHVKTQTKGNAQCLFVSYFMKERKIIFFKNF